MAPVIKGPDVATLIEDSENWQRGRGYFSKKVFQGSEAAIDAKQAELYTGTGGSLESFEKKKVGRAKWQLECYIAGRLSGSPAEDDAETQNNPEWELDADEMEKDLRTHPAFVTPEIAAGRLAILDMAIDTYTDAVDSGTTWTFTTPSGTISAVEGAEYQYTTLRLRGVESYVVPQYRLRRRYVVNKRSSLRASFENVGAVDTPPAPSGLLDNIPDVEWLRCAPDVQVIGKLKWQISQEWLGADAWSAVLYGGTATP